MNNNNKIIVNKNYLKALEEQAKKSISMNDLREKMGMGDIRYNKPKEAPKATEEEIEETITATEIYRQAKLAVVRASFLTPEARTTILMAQGKQVAYGIDKYPEPLNPNTWDVEETVEHIMDESIDRLHYLVTLRIKLEQSLVNGAYNDNSEIRKADSRIASINRMINKAIEEMNYLITLNVATNKETGAVKYHDNGELAKIYVALDNAMNGEVNETIKKNHISIPASKGWLY